MDTDTNTDALKNGSQAQYKLAKKYFDECRLKESLELAIKAASTGNVKAMTLAGKMYQVGVPGYIDYSKTIEYFTNAAKQGDSEAQNLLGVCYANGEGVTQDFGKARFWLNKAASQGNRSAKKNLKCLPKTFLEKVKWAINEFKRGWNMEC